MAMNRNTQAALIAEEPIQVQILCELFKHPADHNGWFNPTMWRAKFEAERGCNIIQYLERFADDYGLLEWKGTEGRSMFRCTDNVDATLDDLKRLLGKQFNDPRDARKAGHEPRRYQDDNGVDNDGERPRPSRSSRPATNRPRTRVDPDQEVLHDPDGDNGVIFEDEGGEPAPRRSGRLPSVEKRERLPKTQNRIIPPANLRPYPTRQARKAPAKPAKKVAKASGRPPARFSKKK